MSDKEQLRNMLDNLINNKAEDAQVNFHSSLQGKMQDVLGTAVPGGDETEAAPAEETSDKE